MKIESLIRPNLLNLNPYSSARSEYSGKAEVFLDANENPVPSDLNRYPDPVHTTLRAAIAETLRITPNQIIIGNGSDEIIDMIIRVFCIPGEDIVRIIRPSFGMYKVAADINDINTEFINLNKDFGLDEDAALEGQGDRHKILFLCSPNNPTGNSLDRIKMIRVINGWKGIVVVDEAYIDFAKQKSLLSELSHLSNMIVLRTFSKALGAAGLRVGYAVASQEIISILHRIKSPYNIGSMVQDRALEIWNKWAERHQVIEMIKKERKQLAHNLNTLSFVIQIFESDANFLLVRFESPLEVKEYLQKRGIIVRDRSKLPGCGGCLRITVGTPSENETFFEALKDFLI